MILGFSLYFFVFFVFKHKTAYELRISDGSSDVCSSDLDSWSGGEPSAGADGESWEARIGVAPQTDARLAALEQLQLVVRTEREAALCAAIIDAVDDNGYLSQPLDGIALQSALQPPPDEAEMRATLPLVQGVEPTGFAARDLRECLQLQIAATPAETADRTLAQTVDADHTAELGRAS